MALPLFPPIFDEFLDYTKTATLLAESALGSIYNKYTKLYESGVVPIFDYCSSVWGYSVLDKIDTIQNRTIRLFLGVHRFAAYKAIDADMGWISCRTRRHVNMLRLCNKLITMDDSRLVKKIINWDKQLKRGRSKIVYDVFRSLNCEDLFLEKQYHWFEFCSLNLTRTVL